MSIVNFHRVCCDNCGAVREFELDHGNKVHDWGTWVKVELRTQKGRGKTDYCSVDCAKEHLPIAYDLTRPAK